MRLPTAEEVAEQLQVSPSWLYTRVQGGHFPHVKVGRYIRFDARDVEAWIDAQRTTWTNGGDDD
jgi:excisionase family DNA binding protein